MLFLADLVDGLSSCAGSLCRLLAGLGLGLGLELGLELGLGLAAAPSAASVASTRCSSGPRSRPVPPQWAELAKHCRSTLCCLAGGVRPPREARLTPQAAPPAERPPPCARTRHAQRVPCAMRRRCMCTHPGMSSVCNAYVADASPPERRAVNLGIFQGVSVAGKPAPAANVGPRPTRPSTHQAPGPPGSRPTRLPVHQAPGGAPCPFAVCAWPAGAFILGFPISALLDAKYGLRAPMYVAAAVGLLNFVLIILLVPESLPAEQRKVWPAARPHSHARAMPMPRTLCPCHALSVCMLCAC